MKEEYKDFVGIYDESVPVELCEEFVKDYEKAKENRTFIDTSKPDNETGQFDNFPAHIRQDEAVYVAPCYSSVLPIPPVKEYFKYLVDCYYSYIKKYSITFLGPVYNDIFKIHKVKKSEGYHVWHYERGKSECTDRLMVYMTYLEAPEEGGETELLHQSLRIDPVVGRTLIWPAGFTHMHRGNPPLEGEKMYITGWFTAPRLSQSASGV